MKALIFVLLCAYSVTGRLALADGKLENLGRVEKWGIYRKVDPIDDSQWLSVFVKEENAPDNDPGYLWIHEKRGNLDLDVEPGDGLKEGNAEVITRIDHLPPITETWEQGDTHAAAPDADHLIQKLMSASTYVVRLRSKTRIEHTLIFDVRGLSQAMATVIADLKIYRTHAEAAPLASMLPPATPEPATVSAVPRKPLAVATPKPGLSVGKWELLPNAHRRAIALQSTSVNPSATLFVRDNGAQPDIFIDANVSLGTGPVTVKTRFDQQGSTTKQWTVSEKTGTAAFAPDPSAFLHQMMAAQSLVVQITPEGSAPIQFEFYLQGLAAASVHLNSR